MIFDIASSDRPPMWTQFLGAVVRLDRANTAAHMEALSNFSVEITVNGRSLAPEVLLNAMVALANQELNAAKGELSALHARLSAVQAELEFAQIVAAGQGEGVMLAVDAALPQAEPEGVVLSEGNVDADATAGLVFTAIDARAQPVAVPVSIEAQIGPAGVTVAPAAPAPAVTGTEFDDPYRPFSLVGRNVVVGTRVFSDHHNGIVSAVSRLYGVIRTAARTERAVTTAFQLEEIGLATKELKDVQSRVDGVLTR